jgi:uncharacterized protein (TIGR02145 family)
MYILSMKYIFRILSVILTMFLILSCERDVKIPSVTDIDGNVYNTIVIGTQTWIKENLKTTRYLNGDIIGTTTPATKDVSTEFYPKYQWAYNGNENSVAGYGRLYTGYAAQDSRNLCPAGWHIPSDAEWTTLTDYLTNNGYGTGEGGIHLAKSLAAEKGWDTYNQPGNVGYDQTSNNSSGFTGNPEGIRTELGFSEIGYSGNWWAVSQFDNQYADCIILLSSYFDVLRNSRSKALGCSVRCIKDK